MNFKKIRELRGLTQMQVANEIGISRPAYANIEAGRRKADYELLRRLALLFEISVDELMGHKKTPDKGVLVPVLGYVPAGVPISVVEEVLGYEEISAEMAAYGDYFALFVEGDSMEPRICHGDIVIVSQQPDVDSGDLAVVLIARTTATIKKVVKKDKSIMLVPYNKAYEPVMYSPKEIRDLPVEIVGKVVELRGRF